MGCSINQEHARKMNLFFHTLSQRSQQTMKHKNSLLLALALTAALILAACQTGGGKNSNPDMPKDVANIVWQWSDLVEQAPASQSVVPNPENYTINFKDDGTVDIKADCNQVSGKYTWGQDLKIELGPSTMAEGDEQSLSQQYLDLLSQVVTGGPDAGRLFLETAGGAQRMGFDKSQ